MNNVSFPRYLDFSVFNEYIMFKIYDVNKDITAQ